MGPWPDLAKSADAILESIRNLAERILQVHSPAESFSIFLRLRGQGLARARHDWTRLVQDLGRYNRRCMTKTGCCDWRRLEPNSRNWHTLHCCRFETGPFTARHDRDPFDAAAV